MTHTHEDIAPTGGPLCVDRMSANIASAHAPLDLIERLMQRLPLTVQRKEGMPTLSMSGDFDRVACSLQGKLEEAVTSDAVGSPFGRPTPVILPAEQGSGNDGPVTLPRSREKAAWLSSPLPSSSSHGVRGVGSDDESNDSSKALEMGASIRASPLAYALVPEGFAIYVDTPLRKRLDDEDEEEEEESDEEEEEESDDEGDDQPSRRVLGVLDMNIEYH